MTQFKYHVLVCTNTRNHTTPGGSCGLNKGKDVYSEFARHIGDAGMGDTIKLSSVDCLGACCLGPIVVVYPDAVWYKGICPCHGVPRIFTDHLMNGKPVEDLLLPEWAWPSRCCSDESDSSCGCGHCS